MPAPGEITGVETGAPLSPGERAAIAERIRKLKIESDKKWDRCARTRSYDEVLTPLTCYNSSSRTLTCPWTLVATMSIDDPYSPC